MPVVSVAFVKQNDLIICHCRLFNVCMHSPADFSSLSTRQSACGHNIYHPTKADVDKGLNVLSNKLLDTKLTDCDLHKNVHQHKLRLCGHLWYSEE